LDLCVGFEAKRLYEKAIGCYQDVLKMKPSSPEEVLERLAQAYWLNGDRDTAIGRFKELAHKHNYDSALLGLGKAVDDTDENVNTDSVPFAFLHLGMLFEKKGDWRRSADQFRRAADLRPNYEDAHRELAKAMVHEGDLSQALFEFIKVARLGTSELDRRYPE